MSRGLSIQVEWTKRDVGRDEVGDQFWVIGLSQSSDLCSPVVRITPKQNPRRYDLVMVARPQGSFAGEQLTVNGEAVGIIDTGNAPQSEWSDIAPQRADGLVITARVKGVPASWVDSLETRK